MMLFSGSANQPLAEQVADHLGMKLGNVETASFANSETYARFKESVRGCDAFVIQSICAPVNDTLMEQLVMIQALKHGSAKRITAVCPLYPYSRQDRKARGREPITARMMADFYQAAGAHRMMSVDLHSGQIQGFFNVPFDHLTALPLLADYYAPVLKQDNFMIVSPDSGGVRLADKWVEYLSQYHGLHGEVAFLHKQRSTDARNVSRTRGVVGDVEGRVCVIVDDMVDTGGTLCNGVDALLDAGAAEVYAGATHPVLSGPAVDRIKNSRLKQLVVTNTLPVPSDKAVDKIEVLSIAGLIAETIKAVFQEGSVSELFHGENMP